MSDSLHPTRPATPRSTSRSQPGSAPRPTPGTLLFPALFALTLLLSLACASGGNGDAREGETNEERRARVAQQEASRMESPSRPLSSYADFELVPATMSDMVTAEEAKVAYVDKLEGMLVEKLGPLFADWERKGMGEGTLQIRPDVQNLKIVSGSARFWGGAMAGSSVIDMNLTLVDASSGEVVASPRIIQHADAMAGAWSFGSTDQNLFNYVTDIAREYMAASY